MKKYLLLVTLLLCFVVLPTLDQLNSTELKLVETYGFSGERFIQRLNSRSNDVPDSILIFMVEFEDVKFDTIPDYPDYVAHDEAYFERVMFHLSSYWSDASYGNYKLLDGDERLYEIYEQIITLPNTMGYYGEESSRGDMIERKIEMVTELLSQVDANVDFNNFDTFMMFHAGVGQEAHSDMPELIQSTFLSRKSFQAALDPENDEFPGVLTQDGTYFNEITIFPESENLPDVTEEEPKYGLLGIIAQGFGYQIGLPTLYDNVSSNGRSFGIGSFGVMGYGVWNAAGYVPPLPCAWSRYFLGWETNNLMEVDSDQEFLEVAYPQFTEEGPRVFKINITDREYFLVENRQQNPDNSIFVNADGDTLVTFTFATIEDQEVYEPGHPFAGEPKFMFMENTYEGCEWDFYLPGYGFGDEPELDGSGILIWHIDENIIEANFSSNFNDNSVNGDASHKGVDLEEADGIQHMDSVNELALGSKDDSYREGNNTYFGKMYPEPGVLSLPTSESYYGGSQIEIYNISSSDLTMTFGVRFGWYLDSDYTGENPFNAAVVNFDDEEDLEIFYPMPDGSIYIWKNYVLLEDYPLFFHPLAAYYAYDEFSGTFIIPTYNEEQSLSRICFLNNETVLYPPVLDLLWAGNPVVNPVEESPYRAFLPFKEIDIENSLIKLYDSNLEEIDEIYFESEVIASNLILKNNILYTITKDVYNQFKFHATSLDDLSSSAVDFSELAADTQIEASIMADVNSDLLDEVIITTSDTLLYLYDQAGFLQTGFPVKIPLISTSLPSIGDVDGNGYLDIIIGGINNIAIVDKNGNISGSHLGIESPDSLYSAPGALALDIDNDTQMELTACMSKNRFSVWEDLNGNTLEMKRNYPISLGDFCSNYPIPVTVDESNSIIYFASSNGTIYRHELSVDLPQPNWQAEYADLQRTAAYMGELPENIFESDSIFLKDQTYIYPNPLSVIFNSSIFNGTSREQTLTVRIMTGIDSKVKLRVFDIAGNSVFTDDVFCEAYIDNCILIDAKDLSSGVYFANLYAQGEVLKLKFAIEK